MAYVDLLRAGGVNAGEVAERGAFRLEFGERIEKVIIVKIVVNRGLLIVIERVIHLDLELIAAVAFLWNGHHFRRGAAGARYVLQKADRYGVEAAGGNLIAREKRAVGNRRAATGNTGNQRLRRR